MMAIASRSLTEPPGLNASTLAYRVTLPGAIRFRRTIGVLPMVPRMLSWIMAKPVREGGMADTTPVGLRTHGHGWHAGKRPMERAPRAARAGWRSHVQTRAE